MSQSAPFASIEVRMIPENVTNAVKSASPDEASPNEKLVQMRHGESFEDVLKANGATPEAVLAISRRSASSMASRRSARGRRLFSCRRSRLFESRRREIARVSVYADDQLKATVAIADSGAYEPVSRRPRRGPKIEGLGRRGRRGGMSLYQSLYETALKQGLPRSIIEF